MQALEWARQQKALSWELRAATSLPRLWPQHAKPEEADKLLASVFDWFNQGIETADLRRPAHCSTSFA